MNTQPPQFFGPYHIKGTLGVGGMGVVYLAEQAVLQRKVALKILAAQLTTDPAHGKAF